MKNGGLERRYKSYRPINVFTTRKKNIVSNIYQVDMSLKSRKITISNSLMITFLLLLLSQTVGKYFL